MSDKYPKKLSVRISRPIFKWGFNIAYNLAARVEITGRKNIPKEGPYIITFNHVSIFDPPLLVGVWPGSPEILGAEYLWDSLGTRIIMAGYGATPVSREYFDRKMLKTAFNILESGNILALAPEGKRSHTPGLIRGMPGIAYIAQKANVPILPVGITGTTSDLFKQAIKMKRPNIGMRIGKQFKLPASPASNDDRKDFRQQNADMVMSKIAELLPEEYRGVYAERVAKD